MSEWSDPAADGERTLGFDEEWEDVATAQLETTEDLTFDIDPPLPAAPISREISTGTLLCNRYLLGALLGSGGSSLIFEAEDRQRIDAPTASRLAVKVLREDKRQNPHALTRLKREFRQMQRLNHPGIARVFELACDDGVWFMTMERIDGCTINQWLKTKPGRNEALKLISACCEALTYAHERGVVHGDLKPSNVIVLPNGGVKLVDFGSAAERDATTGAVEQERSFAATPPWASPQVLAGEVADPRDDVFSLACLTYAVLTRGEHPFARKSSLEAQQLQLRPAYVREIHPRQFDAIVHGLAWAREDRPASVREFLHALLACDLRTTSRDAVSATIEIGRPVRDAAAVSTVPPLRQAPPVLEPAPTVELPHPIAVLPVRCESADSAASMSAGSDAAAANTTPGSEPPASLRRGPASVAPAIAQPATAATAKRTPRMWRRAAFAVAIVGVLAWAAYRLDAPRNAAIPTEVAASPQATVPPAPNPVAAIEAVPPPAPAVARAAREQDLPVEQNAPAPAPVPGEITFTTRTLQVGPKQTLAALTLRRLQSTRGRARVAWTIEGGTARAGVDYELGDSRIVEFLDGQDVRSLFIQLIPQQDSEQARQSKTFTVKLQPVSGGLALGEIKQVHVTIVGDLGESGSQAFATSSVTQ